MLAEKLLSNILVPTEQAQNLSILGHHQAHKLGSEQTGGAFSVWIETVPAESSGPPPHRHQHEDELFYVLEGEITFFDRTGETPSPQGTLFYSPRGTWHGFRNDQKTPARMLIFVTPGGVEGYFQAIHSSEVDTDTRMGPLPVQPTDVEKALTLAPEYGIEFKLS
jgi:mannose-6-phosphate isomerase-like protein (cupin superfamily)